MADNDMLVITGAAGGMGLASACALASRGRLLLVDVDEEQLEAARCMLSEQGARVDTLQCDVTSPADVAAVAERVSAWGRFRCLVHTVSVSPEMAEARTVIEVDLVGSVRVTDAVFPLVEPGSSAILFGSIAGSSDVDPAIEKLLCEPLADGLFNTLEQALDHPIDTATAYVLAKRGVMRLTERLAGPWGAKGGRVVAIAPGLIDTAMGRLELERQPFIPQMVDLTPIKRSGSPLPGRTDDIAALVAFLESDAAAFISGCDIRVDGGLVGAARDMLGGG